MQKRYLPLFFIYSFIYSQVNTEIHLFDIKKTEKGYELKNGKNISNNKGYDSQPYFYNDNIILFSSTRNGQTDIAKYNLKENQYSFVNNTKNGSEYSPQKIPNSKNISAVRLDTNGLQRFYSYNS